MNRILVCALLTLLTLGCAPEPPSDTGYTGTWTRGGGPMKSTLAIVEKDGEYRIRRSVRSDDGKHQVRCDWNGNCEEFVDGEKTSDYTHRTWIDPDTKKLRMEVRGAIRKPESLDLHYVDEFLIKKEGLVLRATTIEVDGVQRRKNLGLAVSKRNYDKISDRVDDPPDGWSTGAK